MIGLGIDTGGTYTDAVIYDFEGQKVLGKAKALTTKEDLTKGIRNVLNQLSPEQMKEAGFLALSTTLATNACVEQIEGRAKLIFIGVEKKTVEEMRERYGLPPVDEIVFLPKPLSEPVGESLDELLKRSLAEYDSAAIVEVFARETNGRYEKIVRDKILQERDIPCMLGSEMFQERNVLQRGASVLLNAKLLPVIRSFQKSVLAVLEEFSLEIPVLIVRSDGSLMSMEYTREHPVETILSGPAASVHGGLGLTEEKQALVVDMGGTTTDVAVIKAGKPLLAKDGISIGGWRTFVKGVFIDTFGLGGDSVLRFHDGILTLGEKRVLPLCQLVSRYPRLISDLEELVRTGTEPAAFPLQEFYVLQRDITEIEREEAYTPAEKAFCRALAEKPLIFQKAAAAAGRDLYNFRTAERLEREGVVIRAGLTPTDIMHVRGDYRAFRADASKLAVRYAARTLGIKTTELCEQVYALIRKKLYCSLMKILMEHTYPAYEKMQKQPGGKRCFDQMLENSYVCACRRIGTTDITSETEKVVCFADLEFRTEAKLIGIGAPIHIFLPDVAKMMGTDAVIPEDASVANALGAVLGNVQACCTIEVLAEYEFEGISGYRLQTGEEVLCFKDHDEALKRAREEAEKRAEKMLILRGGIPGEIVTEIRRVAPQMGGTEMLLKEYVTATASGKSNVWEN